MNYSKFGTDQFGFLFMYICMYTDNLKEQFDFDYIFYVHMYNIYLSLLVFFSVTNITTKRFINVWHRINWIFRLSAPDDYKLLNESIKLMHDFTENIIMERREALEKSISENAQSQEDDEFGQKKRMALLDVLLQSSIAGAPLSNEDIREEVDTFMFEGHDTTTSGISFALYLIARHPEVQKKIVEEIVEVLGTDTERPVTLRDLGDLKYLECVIKESLRLYPPVPMIGRYFTEDVEIRKFQFQSIFNETHTNKI